MNKLCKSLLFNAGKLRLFSRVCMSPTSLSPISLKSYDKNIYSVSKVAITMPSESARRFYVTKSDALFKFGRAQARPKVQFIENDEQYADAEPVEAVGHEVSFADESVKGGFAEFDIPEQLLKRLNELGFKTPFEIQAATLKHTLAGKDVIGKAFTGSGKTLAFAIPIVARVLKSTNRNNPNPKCLVLTPTRELCLQLYESIRNLAPQLKCTSIIGGTRYESQINMLSRGVDIVIATPGRLRDLMQRKNFIPNDIELVCLDEADEMLTPNFLDQIQDVIESCRKDKQMLMFSATMNQNVSQLISDYMKEPVYVDLTKGRSQKLPANIEHYILQVSKFSQPHLAADCIKKFKSERCIVFVNQKVIAMSIDMKLRKMGIRSGALHSDISQTRREMTLNRFRQGQLQVIVATDVASRGIDVPEVDLIIQLECPPSGVDYYVHRSGRTGRAGRMGTSVLFYSESNSRILKELSRLVRFKTLDLPTSQHMIRNDDAEDEFESSPESRPWRHERGEFKKFGGNNSFGMRQFGGDSDRKFSRPPRNDDANEDSNGMFKPRWKSASTRAWKPPHEQGEFKKFTSRPIQSWKRRENEYGEKSGINDDENARNGIVFERDDFESRK